MPRQNSPSQPLRTPSRNLLLRFALACAIATALCGSSLAIAEDDASPARISKREAEVIKRTTDKMSALTHRRLDAIVENNTSHLMNDVKVRAEARGAMRARIADRVAAQLERRGNKQPAIVRR